MKKELAELLKEALETQGREVEIRDDYSGRFMYGDRTIALVGDFTLADVTAALLEKVLDEFSYGDGHDVKEILAENPISKLRQDSMGLGFIIY